MKPVLAVLNIVLTILELRDKEEYWREKWRQYKGRRKWREIKPVKGRAKKYRDMTKREKDKLPLITRYELYFNEYRGAQIERIGDRNGTIVVRYFDGREQELPDVLKWMDLFYELNRMHPAKKL